MNSPSSPRFFLITISAISCLAFTSLNSGYANDPPSTGGSSKTSTTAPAFLPEPSSLRKYEASGSRTVIGFISGKHGEYEVYYRSNQSSVFLHNTSTSVYARVDKKGDGFITKDGSNLTSHRDVLAYVQKRYNRGDLD